MPPQQPAPWKEFRVALSVSPFTEAVLRNGTVFKDGKLTAQTAYELQQMFNAHGANESTRVSITSASLRTEARSHRQPGSGRALLAKAVGIPFNPEIGLWKTYGDSALGEPSPDFSDYPQ